MLAERLRLRNYGLRCPVGVELRDGEALACELLVDASGRGSKLPEFLAGEGRPLPGLRRDVVNSGLVYITCTLKTPPNWRRDKVCLALVHTSGLSGLR